MADETTTTTATATTIEAAREEIAACRQAGSEGRFRDAVRASNSAIAFLASSEVQQQDTSGSGKNNSGRRARLLAAARGYGGMALLRLGEVDAATLALEESYRLLTSRKSSPTNRRGEKSATTGAGSAPLLERVTACLVEACHALSRSPPLPPLAKFPRTPHLFRPEGSRAVTDDDIVIPRGNDTLLRLIAGEGSSEGGLRVSFEEKIDGANLGLSLSLDGSEVLVQNRSHYISHGEHAQFSQLRSWVAVHEEQIKRILLAGDDRPSSSSRRVLYGEWVVARHSIRYDRLPGYFVAFDVSEGDGEFVSRRRFHDLMRGSGIPVVPTVRGHPDMAGLHPREVEGALLRLLQDTPSTFRSDGGPIEGIVIRVDDGDRLRQRAKLVDPDFIAGITGHWAKSKIEKQRVDADFVMEYLEGCCGDGRVDTRDGCHSIKDVQILAEVSNPRQRFAVSYSTQPGVSGQQFIASCAAVTKQSHGVKDRGTAVILPRNLSWLWQGEVLVASTPKSEEQVRAMRDALGVGLIITLTKEEPLPPEWFSNDDNDIPECSNSFCPIADGAAPTLREMDNIGDSVVPAVASGRAVLVHCGGGKGRAGTVASCLLLRFGSDGIRSRIERDSSRHGDGGSSAAPSGRVIVPRPPDLSGEEAMTEIRRRRPGSLETHAQEHFVREYAKHLWRIAADLPEGIVTEGSRSSLQHEQKQQEVPMDTPAVDLTRKGKKTRGTDKKEAVPKYIVLAGLPGSGKSSLAARLCNRNEQQENLASKGCRVHVSTDELGKKRALEAAGRAASAVARGSAAGVIVDACNVTANKRREWVDVMFRPRKEDTALLFFDVPREVCKSRIRCRVDHPTIPFGRGGRIVEGFAKELEPPSTKEVEGRDAFGEVAVLQSPEDVSSLLVRWGLQ